MAFNPLLRTRKLRLAALLCAAASVSLMPVQAQEEGPDAPDSGYNSLEVAQPKGTRELQNALQRLAVYPGDVDALIDAGNAALLLQDPQAAIGFFARAEEMSPGNGRIKAGLGSALLLNENPYEALRLFDEARKLGVPETVYAADRGLAYDLVGNFNAAQDDYELALRRGGDDETIRRYALSLGISGDRAGAEAQLDPLLRKRDAAAWRTRAFVLAIAGDAEGAIAIADATMPKRMAASIEPFFRFMGRLTPAQQAAAAHFGQFPAAAAMGKDDPRNRQYASLGTQRARPGRADAGLIPVGDPLGPAADAKGRKVAKVDKSQRRRPGKLSKKEREAIALAQAEAAAKPVPVQARAPGPVPPPDLLIPGRGGPTSSPVASTVQTARATVQPLPSQTASAPSRATVQAQSSDLVSARPRGSMANPAPAPAAPTRVASAPPSVSRTNGGQTSVPAPQSLLPPANPSVQATAPIAQPPAGQAGALAQSAVNPAPPMIGAGDRPVLLSGVNELPRPGFASVPAPAGDGQAVAVAPVQGPGQGFDLAEVGGRTAQAPSGALSPAPGTVQPTLPAQGSEAPVAVASAAGVQPAPSEPEPARVTLASVIASITVPPGELALAEDAVDVTKLKPAPKLPDDNALAARKAEEDRKLAEAKAAEDKKLADKKLADKKAADKKAADDKKLAEKKAAEKKAAAAKTAAPKHPKRYWVQVAGGANRADLSKEWKRLTTASPALFKGKQGWWTPLNATNRLLTGPFKSSDEAQAFVNTLSKNKLSGFTFTSPAGQEVTALGK